MPENPRIQQEKIVITQTAMPGTGVDAKTYEVIEPKSEGIDSKDMTEDNNNFAKRIVEESNDKKERNYWEN